MGFDSNSASKAGKISKRGRSLPMDLRNSLNDLVNQILNDLNYEELTPTQKIKLLDICLKHTLPKVEVTEYEEPKESPKIEIAFVENGKEVERNIVELNENFQFKDLVR